MITYLLGADVFGVAEVVNDGVGAVVVEVFDGEVVDEVFAFSGFGSDFASVTGDNFCAAFSEN